jgi:Tfp pilus assembly protein PilO
LKLAFSFVAVLLLANAVLYLIQTVLSIEYQAAKKSSEATQTKNIGKENRMKKIFQETNNQVTGLSKISSSLPNWARVLARISELCPNDVRIKQLSSQSNSLALPT